jgi:ATP-dependent Clp protease ATP-binding subunit ClpC
MGASEEATMADRSDRFTAGAHAALRYAQEEARGFNHNYIGTEHQLLGLVREDEGAASAVLSGMGIDLPRVRAAVERIIGRGDRWVVGEIGLTPRAKKAIELAVAAARRLGHDRVGAEHLLLGIVEEGNGVAAGVLVESGAPLPVVRERVLAAIGAGDEPPRPGTPA